MSSGGHSSDGSARPIWVKPRIRGKPLSGRLNLMEHLEKWRTAGAVGAKALQLGASLVRPGASMLDVAEEVEAEIRRGGCLPSFPANISVDVEAAHFTPPPDYDRRFQEGEVVKLDVGAHLEGCISDNATTIEVGSARRSTLLAASRDALDSAERVLHGGLDTTEVTSVIEGAIQRRGFKPVTNLMGHTVEPYSLHAGKSVPNSSVVEPAYLETGEVVAVEPFATNGAGEIHNGPFGNIMRFRQEPDRERESDLHALYSQFRTLPFCLRWVKDRELHRLPFRKKPFIQSYPVFIEVGGGIVSQAEATFLLTEDGAERLTRVG